MNKDKEAKEAPEAENEVPVQDPDPSKAKEYWDKLLRLKADFENIKKRLEKDKSDAIKFANERLLAEILPIVDNFDRAMASLSEGHDPEKVKEGLRLAQNELHEVLEEHGVEVVKSVGTEFNPQLHEAVGVVDTPGAQDGLVVEEIQRGYILNGRLLRPSRVRIAKNIQKTEDRGQKAET